jgi:TPR repeat protein
MGVFNYADIFHDAGHVEQNVQEAVRLSRFAMGQAVNEALYALCEICRTGAVEISADPRLATQCARRLAEQNEFLGFVG